MLFRVWFANRRSHSDIRSKYQQNYTLIEVNKLKSIQGKGEISFKLEPNFSFYHTEQTANLFLRIFQWPHSGRGVFF